MNEILELTDEEVNSLSQAILKRHGIDFTCYEIKSFKRRISRAISVLGHSSIHELWVRILKEPKYIHLFMDEISVGLTSMFRDPVMWKSLKKLLASNSTPNLNIWHAGCSTGEEVYSLGIVLKDLELANKTKALATDISLASLENARNGVYHEMKYAEFEENYKQFYSFGSLSKHSKIEDRNICFDKSLISHVSFNYHNLITDTYSEGYDYIFCRNVMIYFDTAAKMKILDKFHKSLKPGGFLIIGFFDALMPLIDESKFSIYDLNAKIFQSK